MNKPQIPSIEKEEEVIKWFLKYDEKTKGVFDNPAIFNKAEKEIFDNLKENSDASSLQSFIGKVSDYYTEFILPAVEDFHKKNEELPTDLIVVESLLTAKMRILGYFFLKKYNIQPE